jgi:hypothetical protein
VRQLRTVSRLLAAAAATLIFATAPLAGQPAGVALAAPAALSAAFRDLPSSIRAGDVLGIQVSVPGGATCDGTIIYRDGNRQKLDSRNESGSRCRWDITVPVDTRRGTADIDVNVKRDAEQSSITASIEVSSRGDDIEIAFDDLPAAARRGDEITIRTDVTDGSTCVGSVTYDDGRVQSLDSQAERRQRCRWEMTVATDAPYGPAKVRITVTEGSGVSSLSSSFEVAREANDSHLQIGLKDLPTNVKREDSYAVRALVPAGAKCIGQTAYYGAVQNLEEIKESNGECLWTARVPSDARPGTGEIRVTVRSNNDEATAVAALTVDRSSSDFGATFKDLQTTVRRGDNLEIRVNVPNGSQCDGTYAYYDSSPQGLGAQTERKDRCLWSFDVPSSAPRGQATIRVTVTEGGDSTTLVGNVEVISRNEKDRSEESKVSKAVFADGMPTSAKPGESFDVRVNAPEAASCSGKIVYSDGMRWMLGRRDEDSSQCRWNVTVPTSVGPGKATIEVAVNDSNGETKLNANFDVKSSTLATSGR